MQIVAWNWDFGDGETSAEQSPSHTYASEGWYYGSLTVTDEFGGTNTQKFVMKVSPALTELSWDWDFGDGHSDSGTVVSNTFLRRGSFTVVLTITNFWGYVTTATATIDIEAYYARGEGVILVPHSSQKAFILGAATHESDVLAMILKFMSTGEYEDTAAGELGDA